MLKKIRWLAYALLALLLLAWALVWTGVLQIGPHGAITSGVSLPGGVSVGGPFALRDSTGKTVRDSDFRGRYMLIYFGYTFCPDICPTELQTVANALDLLGDKARAIAPIFITVDPERDTPAVVGEYVKLFHPDLIGLSGDEKSIAAAIQAYRVFASKTETRNSTEYLMNHSSFIYLMDRDGKLAALFRQGTAPKDIADAVQARMARGN